MSIKNINKKIAILSALLISCTVLCSVSCQSDSRRREIENANLELQVAEAMTRELEKKNAYDKTPEGKKKLKEQAAIHEQRRKVMRCKVIWNRADQLKEEMMGSTISIEKFKCKGGQLYSVYILGPGLDCEVRKEELWPAAKIMRECPANWRRWGHPCK